MKTSRAQVEKNREGLLKAASEGFRRKGFDGIRVSEIMREVGMTHGGFYNYFDSKDDLVAEACGRALFNQAGRLKASTEAVRAGADEKAELSGYIDRYLTTENRDDPARTCLFPSLSVDVARQGEPVRRVYTEGLRDYLDTLSGLTPAKKGDLSDAMAILSTLVGAMVLARAVDDENLSEAILVAAKSALKQRYASTE